MDIYIGTSGYAYKEWKGKFYPEKIAADEMLRFYSQRFRTVEINNTFYHLPTEGMLRSWLQQVPENFIFALKASQRITHVKRLRNVDSETEYLLETISALGTQLGPLLFQFPKTFRVERQALQDFLTLIPGYVPCAFLFRNPSTLDNEILDLLREKGRALCIEDTEDAPAGKVIGTANWGHLRLRRPDYSEADLARWAERILSRKWEKAFVYFKHEEEARGPQMAMRFGEIVGSMVG